MSLLKFSVLVCLAIAGLSSVVEGFGPKAQVVIINRTPYNFKKVYEHSYQMPSWRWPKSVPAGKDETGFVEFEHGRGYHRFDNAGEVDYELEGAGIKFRIHSDEKFNPQLYATLDGFPAVNLIWKEGAFLYLFISGNKDNLDIKKIY